MPQTRRFLLIGWTVVLALCLLVSFFTRGAMANLPFLQSRMAKGGTDVVDQLPLQTAQALAPLAVSAEEQAYSRESVRLADHEVDQAFAMALRQANAESRTLTGRALEVSQKVALLQATVKQDQAAVDALTASAKTRGIAAGGDDDDLDVAKAQLALDTDELSDANDNLAIVSGDQRGKIQEELAAHEAGMKKYNDQTGGEIAAISTRKYATLAGRLVAWFDQRSRMAQLDQAKQQADRDVKTLQGQYDALQQKAATLSDKEKTTRAAADAPTGVAAAAAPVPAVVAAPSVAPRTTRLALMRRLEAQRNILGILNDRVQGQQELSALYAKWQAQVQLQHSIVLHLISQSFAWIAFIVLCAVLADMLMKSIVNRSMQKLEVVDRRSMHTLQTILQLAIQFVMLLLILLVVFGPPSQIPTILGLATAGLTVVFQDFILAFFGWFVLMGKNGIRVGDWVEIDGVAGEVIEIGLIHTALLETGNWTDKGHPTGRRIRFVNKFAVSGKYFNFSTNGQWMWDEIKLNVPASEQSTQTIESIHHAVVEETAKDAELAQREWSRQTNQHGMSQFNATPTVEMRPAAAGIDLVVRYVTRAGERLETRNRLYESVIALLRADAAKTLPEA